MELSEGDRIDRYVLVRELGEGSQGAVWLASDTAKGGGQCAVKLLDIHRAEPTALERLRREARALAKLEHPSLPRCSSLFEDMTFDVAGLAMEYIDGPSLAEVVDDPRLTAEHRLLLLSHIVRALAHVHRNGIVHRDVKCENIVLTHTFWHAPKRASNVKLVDFGIASKAGQSRLTAVGYAIGTPMYMAPEQIDPRHWGIPMPTPASDVFALGILVWRLFFGGHPSGLRDDATMTDLAAAYRRVRDLGLTWPPRVPAGQSGKVVGRCLALHVKDRFPSAIEVVDVLRATKQHARAKGDHKGASQRVLAPDARTRPRGSPPVRRSEPTIESKPARQPPRRRVAPTVVDEAPRSPLGRTEGMRPDAAFEVAGAEPVSVSAPAKTMLRVPARPLRVGEEPPRSIGHPVARELRRHPVTYAIMVGALLTVLYVAFAAALSGPGFAGGESAGGSGEAMKPATAAAGGAEAAELISLQDAAPPNEIQLAPERRFEPEPGVASTSTLERPMSSSPPAPDPRLGGEQSWW